MFKYTWGLTHIRIREEGGVFRAAVDGIPGIRVSAPDYCQARDRAVELVKAHDRGEPGTVEEFPAAGQERRASGFY